ncbi:helix-turn-helix transcriptional regulator [Burkholderia multivorans]|nr:helix-turn-helix transcriptional regulator [Burkholderia multivorans]MBU9648332.1 helix-turn-helix transcriptional regulator [Burkholderia multivorans]
MSEIILLLPESSTSTTPSAFLGFPDIEPVAMTSSTWLCQGTLVPEAKRSPRTGRLPFGASLAQREAADADFRGRMASSRQRLAGDLSQDERSCIARLRLQRGLSQQRLAVLSGLSQPHLAKIEAGKLSIQLATAVRLADALGVSLDELRPLVEQVTVEPKVTGL